MDKTALLTREMIRYEAGEPHRIQHFVKVHDFSRMIGLLEGLDAHLQFVLETAALVHDIGIRPSMEKYGDADGKHQEQEGPAVARSMLEALGYEADVIDRVCYLVGHHHTYTDICGMDYQILVEADFLVNLFEGNSSGEAIAQAQERIFKTAAGKAFCRDMFQPDVPPAC